MPSLELKLKKKIRLVKRKQEATDKNYFVQNAENLLQRKQQRFASQIRNALAEKLIALNIKKCLIEGLLKMNIQDIPRHLRIQLLGK